MSKKEEGRLTPKENLQLKLHLRICSFCTRFQKQVRFFTKNALHTHEHLQQNMREEKKATIKAMATIGAALKIKLNASLYSNVGLGT